MTKTVDELIDNLKVLKDEGFVKTRRSGNTGVGKTLEEFLGVEENNLPYSDGYMTELKSSRKKSSSMLSLFTKFPLPKKINTQLLKYRGYSYKNGKALHTTVSSGEFNTLKGKPGFKIHVKANRVELIHYKPYKSMLTPYWDMNVLKERFLNKYPDKLLYVKADSRGRGKKKSFTIRRHTWHPGSTSRDSSNY